MTEISHHRGSTRSMVLGVLISSVVSGCGTEEDANRSTTTVDNLPTGAVHVVHTPPADPRPTFTIEEELRIGSLDGGGPATFAQLKGLVVLEAGRMAVLDAQAQEVRVFRPDGRHLATHGGKGSGPGEFETAFGLMRGPEGRLWVPDHRNARMSVLDPIEGFQESFPLTVLSRAFVWEGVMGEDGRIFKPSLSLGPPRRDILRVYGPDMELLDSLPVPEPPDVDPDDPASGFTWEAPDGKASVWYGVPFYPVERSLIDPLGRMWTTYPGDPSYRIKRWTPGGDTTLVLETLRPPAPVTAAERDSAVEVPRQGLRKFAAPAANQDWSKIPEVKPAVLSMFMAEEGDLWVEIGSNEPGHTFDIYGPDGRYVGTAVTRLRLHRFLKPIVRGDRFWAVVTDELDVPYVVRGRIVPVEAA